MTITNKYLSDTEANILSSSASPARLAISTDTKRVYISTGSEWKRASRPGADLNKHSTWSGKNVHQTPHVWLDATDSASFSDTTGSNISNNEQVSEWRDKTCGRRMIQPSSIKQPTYMSSVSPNNKPGLLFDGFEGMVLSDNDLHYTGGNFTVICAFTPSKVADTTRVKGDVITNEYPGGRYGFTAYPATTWYNQVWNCGSKHHHTQRDYYTDVGVLWQYSNNNNYFRILENLNHPEGSLSFDQYNQDDVYKTKDGLNNYDHWSNNWLSKTHISVLRASVDNLNTQYLNHSFLDSWYYNQQNRTFASPNYYARNYSSDRAWWSLGQMSLGANFVGATTSHYRSYMGMHELIAFPGALTDSETTHVGKYLFDKWCATTQTFVGLNKGNKYE